MMVFNYKTFLKKKSVAVGSYNYELINFKVPPPISFCSHIYPKGALIQHLGWTDLNGQWPKTTIVMS